MSCPWYYQPISTTITVLTNGRSQMMQEKTWSVSVGVPQGCGLCPLLFSLYPNACTSRDQSVKLLKFADVSIVTWSETGTHRTISTLSRSWTSPESGNGQQTSLLTHHTPDTTFFLFSPLVAASLISKPSLWSPESVIHCLILRTVKLAYTVHMYSLLYLCHLLPKF